MADADAELDKLLAEETPESSEHPRLNLRPASDEAPQSGGSDANPPENGSADSAAESSESDKDDLDQALEEWDRHRANREQADQSESDQAEPDQPEAPQQEGVVDRDQRLRDAVETDLRVNQMRKEHQRLLDQQDYKSVLDGANQRLADEEIPVGENEADRWLKSELATNHEFRNTLEQRYQSDIALYRAERAIEKALKRMVGEFKQRPDPQLTADRRAVAAAVKGASKKSGPDYDEIDEQAIAQMSDHEFHRWTKDVAPKLMKTKND